MCSAARSRIPGYYLPIAVSLVLVATVPQLADDLLLYVGSMFGIYLLAALGLNLLLGYTGQVSLGQGALVALGAYTTAILTVRYDWPFWLSVIPAIAVASFIAALMCIPALRLSSWYLGMITLVLSAVIQGLILNHPKLTGGGAGVIGVPPLSLGGDPLSPKNALYVIVAIDIVALIVIANLVRSPWGRAFMAVRDSLPAARASAVSVPRIKLLAFIVAAMCAGLAGALWASLNGVVTFDQFGTDLSILLLLMVLVGGEGLLDGPIYGALVLVALPQILTGFTQYRFFVFGGLLLITAVFAPKGIAGVIRRPRRRTNPETAPSAVPRPGPAPDRSEPPSHEPDGPSAPALVSPGGPSLAGGRLEVVSVSRSFGGVQALRDVNVTFEPGSVHGLIGPNGSGKTTLINVLSGFYPPDRGSVRLGGRDVTAWRASRLARNGVARTFQHPQLLGKESALTNVMLGAYGLRSAHLVEWLLRLPRTRRENLALRRDAMAQLAFLGLDDVASVPVDQLSHGERRLLEIGRALASQPRLLLLDEPAAGLTEDDILKIVSLIGQLRAAGVTVVLVEHHVDLVIGTVDHLTVLDKGEVLADGTPQDVMARGDVLRAYVGAVP